MKNLISNTIVLLLTIFFTTLSQAQEQTAKESLLKDINDAYVEYRVQRKYDNYVRFKLKNGNLVIDNRGNYSYISIKKLKRIKVIKSGDFYGIKFFSPWGISNDGIDPSFGTTMISDIETKKGAKSILELLNQLVVKP